MINRLSHTTIYCFDQDEALRFYRDTLGFVVRSDETMDGFRWLSVTPLDQEAPEMVLMPVGPNPWMDEQTANTLADLVRKGAMGTGVLETDDCRRTVKELAERGVTVVQEPTERPYGIEAVFTDPSGNWFSLTERYA